MTTPFKDGHHHVFIGGLHRSGTSLMGELIGCHPDVSELHATGVPEDEGQHLQEVYPKAKAHGGPGRFAFAPAAHLTETSELLTPSAAASLVDAWSPYWDLTKPVLVEKSPPNLLMGRFLQAAFPGSSFIMIMRHPVAVSRATSKWTRQSVHALIGHWLKAYETMVEDIPFLERVIVVRYEDLVDSPDAVMAGVFSFLDLPPAPSGVAIQSGINEKYFQEWQRPGLRPFIERHRARSSFASRIAQFSYDFETPTPAGPLPASLPQLPL